MAMQFNVFPTIEPIEVPPHDAVLRKWTCCGNNKGCGKRVERPTKTCPSCGHRRCQKCCKQSDESFDSIFEFKDDVPIDGAKVWTCCGCGDGPKNPEMEPRCNMCGHQRCRDCSTKVTR